METTSRTGLRSGSIGPIGIIFFVIATNGPLIGLVGAVPLALTLGNGIGVAGTFVLAGLVYLLFSVGFAAMSRHIKNAGAFYAYVGRGLGRPSGVSAAFLAITSYIAIQLACYAMIGFFLTQLEQTHLGSSVPWWLNAAIVGAIVLICGYRNVEFSGKLLGALMLGELTIMLVFDIAVLIHGGGPEGLSLSPFLPGNVLTGGLGAAMVFIISSYFGFETTAIYSEEARNPRRTIPIAMYGSILVIMAFFALSVWSIIVAYGPSHVVEAARQDPGNLWFAMAAIHVGPTAAEIMNVMMITSLFAALVSIQNAVSRYFFALGREHVLPEFLSRVHPKQQSPYVASICQSLLAVLGIAGFALAGADPMDVMLPMTATFASVGIVVVQLMTSFAVVCFFRRQPSGPGSFQTVWAPLLSGLSLFAIVWLIVANIGLLTGDNPVAARILPLAVLSVGAFGYLYAVWMAYRHPVRYSALRDVLNEM